MAAQPKRPLAAAPRRRRARGSITSEEILHGAFELCEADGVDGLSMPRLAQHLDVGVTSIYWYFKSKEDLMDALTEEAFKRFYGKMPPREGRAWDEVLREFFTNFRGILRADDVLLDLTLKRGESYADDTIKLTWQRIEEILKVLVDAGFSEDSAAYAYFTLSVYTRGSLMIERLMRGTGASPQVPHPRAHLAAMMPIMSREAERHSWYMVSDDDFAFGIENNIRGQ
jgi:AcrR family transcriptional regulator